MTATIVRTVTENNSTQSVGIFPQPDGTFDAMTLAASKNFKSRKAAAKWLAARGYEVA